MSNGHTWLDVQQYSLSEIGGFLKGILKQEQINNVNQLTFAWMGNHLTEKAYLQFIDSTPGSTKPTKKVQQESSAEAVHAEWKRMASFMRGKT